MLIAISSPHRKSGIMYTRHKSYFGQDDDEVLVVQGPSLSFNPTLNVDAIEKARQDDPEAARSEWDAEFRSDVGAFLSEEDIEAAIDVSRPTHIPPRPTVSYSAYADPSGGRKDAYTLAIGHVEKGVIIVDCLLRRPSPLNPDAVSREYYSPTA